jgi:putative membrane protein
MVMAFGLLALLVGLLHIGFMVLEMFLWATPTGLKIFKMTAAQAEATKVLAMNQGLYNGLLAAGLFYAYFTGDYDLATVFFVFVAIVGVFGAVTASPTIFFLQALPAIIALILRIIV